MAENEKREAPSPLTEEDRRLYGGVARVLHETVAKLDATMQARMIASLDEGSRQKYSSPSLDVIAAGSVRAAMIAARWMAQDLADGRRPSLSAALSMAEGCNPEARSILHGVAERMAARLTKPD